MKPEVIDQQQQQQTKILLEPQTNISPTKKRLHISHQCGDRGINPCLTETVRNKQTQKIHNTKNAPAWKSDTLDGSLTRSRVETRKDDPKRSQCRRRLYMRIRKTYRTELKWNDHFFVVATQTLK